MNRALYVRTVIGMCFFIAGCWRQPEDPSAQRMETLRAVLITLRDVEIAGAEQHWYYARDMVSRHGNRPADSALLVRAQNLLRQASEMIPGLTLDTLPQRLHQLDRLASLLGKATPYTRTKRISRYLDLLAEAPGDTAVAGALLAGLQVETARHTKVLLAAVRRQLESRVPYQLRLIPVVRATPHRVREGASYRVEVFPLEIFMPSPEWRLTMYANGQPVPLEGGIGKVRLQAEGPPGKKTWEGKLLLQCSHARDTSFYGQFSYVALPH